MVRYLESDLFLPGLRDLESRHPAVLPRPLTESEAAETIAFRVAADH